ncbi:MAG: glycosyltransferase family 2 protein [Anaerolineales bacterium]|nr:glycosyltransferase family 2 protein [Anaerolineales bacterium]
MNLPNITAVVLNTNRKDDTLACLQALAVSGYANLRVIVLDNHSTDGSAEAIGARFPAVQVVSLERNLGYAGNNNVGIRLALEQGADWIFVENEDTLVEPGCFDALIAATQADPRIGVIGPLVYTFDPGRTISSGGGRVLWTVADAENIAMGAEDVGQLRAGPVDFINGCGLLISRQAVERVGALDDSFFIYFEETDWCQRVRKAGFEVWFEPKAVMRHKAPITWAGFGPSTLYYMTRNRIRFFARHTPWPQWPLAMARALRGAWRGAGHHQREGRPEHARATQIAISHALQRRWGKVDPSLWKTDAGDRTLAHPTG